MPVLLLAPLLLGFLFVFVGNPNKRTAPASAPGHKPLLPTKVYFFFFFKKKCWLEGRFVGELRENGHGRVAKG